jgi:hypothetical protein
VTFIKIRSHRRKFSNSDSVEQKNTLHNLYIGCSFKFLLKVGVEETIMNVSLRKNTNNVESEVRFKQLIRKP